MAVCVRCIRSAPANWKCTSDKRTRGCTAAERHEFEKHAKRYHQPRERDDLESLVVFWRSAGDQLEQLMEMLKARYCRDTLVQLLRRIAIMSENQTRSSGDDRVWCVFFDCVTRGDAYLYKSKLWSHDLIRTQAPQWRADQSGWRREDTACGVF